MVFKYFPFPGRMNIEPFGSYLRRARLKQENGTSRATPQRAPESTREHQRAPKSPPIIISGLKYDRNRHKTKTGLNRKQRERREKIQGSRSDAAAQRETEDGDS